MNQIFSYRSNKLFFNEFDLSQFLSTHNYQKPVYLYDLNIILKRYLQLRNSLKTVRLFYAMKANSNQRILELLKLNSCSVDVVSKGEIEIALLAGFEPFDIVFSGVGKTKNEIQFAIEKKIYQINVESVPELKRVADIAFQLKIKTAVALRINPNISIKTHPSIATGLKENKFGIEASRLTEVIQIIEKSQYIELVGVSLHLGSQMLEYDGFREALRLLRAIYLLLKEKFKSCSRFDVGGGLGIFYEEDNLAQENILLLQYSQIIDEELQGLEAELQSEPGRWIVGHAGILISQVQYIKETDVKKFMIIDAGMTHLLRPALYNAYHQIFPVHQNSDLQEEYDIVGPICESTDVIARNRKIHSVNEDDFVIIATAGAYGFSMSSTYNQQSLPDEVFIELNVNKRMLK